MTGGTPRPDTWMPFYIGDYLADTAHLSPAEHGAYILLIFAYWRAGGPLPDDDAKLARVARMTATEWDTVKDTIKDFFRSLDGLLSHSRIDQEIAEAKRVFAARQERSRKANAEKAKIANKDTGKEPPRNLDGSLRPPQPQPQPHSPSEIERGADAPTRKSKKIDLGVWELDEKGRGIIEAAALSPADTMAKVRDWAANAGSKRLKTDPHAFLRNWCRSERERFTIPKGLERTNGEDRREYLGTSTMTVAEATALAKLMNDNAKARPPSLNQQKVGALVAHGLVPAERAREWGFSA